MLSGTLLQRDVSQLESLFRFMRQLGEWHGGFANLPHHLAAVFKVRRQAGRDCGWA